MGDVLATVQQNSPNGQPPIGKPHIPNGIQISDLTSKYQQKIDNYNLMINSMSEEQKKIFQTAINLYDIQRKQDMWDSYVGYALKALLMNGWYYNVMQKQWQGCMTPETYVPTDPKMEKGDAYRRYMESLYPRSACSMLGISRWDILDTEVDGECLKKAVKGEMTYEHYDLDFSIEDYEVGGEVTGAKQKPQKIVHPQIPVSPNIDVTELTKGDNSKDKFIYAYTDSGVSKNKRNWRPMIMDRIAQQVMELNPPGNMGHVDPKNIGYELPLPVITWIGATTELLPSGSKRLWLKGYIINTQEGVNLKTYIRAKAINSISVYGGLTLIANAETGNQDVLDIDLKSIDISGKLKEGLNSGITELAGEMSNPNRMQNMMLKDSAINNSESEVKEDMAMNLNGVTLADIKINNPQLFGEMRSSIIEEMKLESEQKVTMQKAGEMDTLTAMVGGNPTEAIKDYQKFAGEMAEAVGLPMPNGVALPDMEAIKSKVSEIVGSLKSVVGSLKPAEGQTIEARAEELAKQNQLAQNTQAIQSANDKFNELTAGIQNDAVKSLVAMQYDSILNAKPESLADDYATTSIATLEQNVPNTIKSVTENAQKLMQSGQQAGEMALYANLGVGSGAGTQPKSTENMSDVDLARSLGYGEQQDQ